MRYLCILTLVLVFSCKDVQVKEEQTQVDKSPDISTQPKDDHNHGMEGRMRKFETVPAFNAFNTEPYRGKLSAPDFAGNPLADDPQYVKLITEGCREGINFGGNYTIIHKDCGTMCERIFIVDRITGKVFTTIKIKDGKYGYAYKKDSMLLIANSGAFVDDTYTDYNDLYATPEFYVWEGNDFKFLQ